MMRALVVGEYRLFRGPDGHVYAESVFGHAFWKRYLDVFSGVVVVARVGEAADVSSMLRVDGPGVEVYPMPYYVGLAGYLRNALRTRRAAGEVARMDGALILRLPGALGSAVQARARRRLFAVEIVGDPLDVFAPGVVELPLRRLIRWSAVRRLRRLARRASAVSYVSKYRLAGRYPAAPGVPTFAYSSASLPKEAFATEPRTFNKPLERIIAIGSMEQMYKGFDVLLRAFAEARQRHPRLHLTLVGGGRFARSLHDLADELGVLESVTFAGLLTTPAEVRRAIDRSDLLVSASLTEGLPRTVLEAQARGLPCVGTDVGATAELVLGDYLVPAADTGALVSAITRLTQAPSAASVEARRGWEASYNYGQAKLQQSRNDMFEAIRSVAI
jgi:phosphatidylinositol alpha-1,6-mannosyltransferase